ncbi:MAG: phospholipid carrier-dependent glycosyltransferase [bacterium]
MRERTWLAIIIITAGVATQFMWLDYPREVVFDEVHFGKFVTAYCCTGERFFDIHPPHAKLLVAGMAKLAGYKGGLSFSSIGQKYGDVSPIGFRLVPAIMGVLLPLVLFRLLRQLGGSYAAAFLGAIIAVFDNALTVQNRIISLDGLLLVAIFGAISAYLWMENKQRWVAGGLLTGALCGLAVGAKFTGLAAVGLIGVLIAWSMLRATTYRMLRRYLAVGLLIAVSGMAVYGAGWALHFALLPLPGSGDAWRVPQWNGFILTDFIRETKELHKIMYDANYNLEATHQDASSWWSWPIMQTSVFYWVYGGGEGRAGAIYFLGNPLVWWGGSALFIIVLFFACLSLLRRLFELRRKFSIFPAFAKGFGGRSNFQFSNMMWILIFGYFIAYVPLMRVPRALFLYHYLMPLLFALLAGVLWLDGQGFFKPGSVLKQPKYYFVLLGAVVAMFVIFSPLTYGFLLPRELHDMLFWLDTWR